MAFSFNSFSLTPNVLNSNGASLPPSEYMAMHREKLKEIQKIVANSDTRSPVERLLLVDNLQHLAIDYHFRGEIHSILTNYYKSLKNGSFMIINSASIVSLGFRLLRQNGYPASTDVFKRFIDNQGNFMEELQDDLGEMMSLYQATQFGMEEEVILDQASIFTRKNLVDRMPHLEQDQVSVTSYYLDHPYHKTLPRFNLKQYIKFNGNGHKMYGNLFLEFAKLDFNLVQSLHQRELLHFSSWWRDLGLAQKLDFARDQPVKWYIGSMATLDDPRLSQERIYLTKPIALVFIMDDIFDVHGSLDELVLFTEAINKWEVEDGLPYTMKLFLKVLYRITDEISYEILQKHGWDPKPSLKKAWVHLCNAFLVEAKWFAYGQLPTSEEYLKNGVISSGLHVMFVHVFFLLGEGISKQNVDLLDKVPSIISNAATILRLLDDLESAKDENQNGYDGSYIDYYLKENKNSTLENARRTDQYDFSHMEETEQGVPDRNSFPTAIQKSLIKRHKNGAFGVQL